MEPVRRWLSLDRMSLSGRLIAGFELVLGPLLLITALALVRMQRMGANLRDIVEVHNAKIDAAQSMVNAIHEMSVAIFSSGASQDQEDVDYSIAQVGKSFERYTTARQDIGSKIDVAAATSASASSEQLRKIDAVAAEARTVIDSQSSILALNAAVEAASAGESGRGLAVVASEVRAFAQRSAGAAEEIKQLIRASVETVERGAQLVSEAGGTMEEIVRGAAQVNDVIAQISAAPSRQHTGIPRWARRSRASTSDPPEQRNSSTRARPWHRASTSTCGSWLTPSRRARSSPPDAAAPVPEAVPVPA